VVSNSGAKATGQWFPVGVTPRWPEWSFLLPTGSPLPPQRNGGFLGDPGLIARGDVVWIWDRGAQTWSSVVRAGNGDGSFALVVADLLARDVADQTQAQARAIVAVRERDGTIRAVGTVTRAPTSLTALDP